MKELLETIQDKNKDYVGLNGCLYQDLERKELDLIINYINQLETNWNKLKKRLKEEMLNSLTRFETAINEMSEYLDEKTNVNNMAELTRLLTLEKILNAMNVLESGNNE